jgi:hypothetical protein
MQGVGFSDRLLNATVASILRKARLLPTPEHGDLGQIPKATLQHILKSRPIIRVDGLYSPSSVDGSLPWCDVTALLSIAIERSPKTVVEIGTLHGNTTRLLAINLPNSHIYTIDLPENEDPTAGGLEKDDLHLIRSRRLGAEFRSDPSIRNVTQLLGDTATMEFPSAEFFYIDGSHTYEYVKNDTQRAMSISEAKTIIWHDCDVSHPGVTKWLCEMVDAGCPVRRIIGTNLAVLYR